MKLCSLCSSEDPEYDDENVQSDEGRERQPLLASQTEQPQGNSKMTVNLPNGTGSTSVS